MTILPLLPPQKAKESKTKRTKRCPVKIVSMLRLFKEGRRLFVSVCASCIYWKWSVGCVCECLLFLYMVKMIGKLCVSVCSSCVKMISKVVRECVISKLCSTSVKIIDASLVFVHASTVHLCHWQELCHWQNWYHWQELGQQTCMKD